MEQNGLTAGGKVVEFPYTGMETEIARISKSSRAGADTGTRTQQKEEHNMWNLVLGGLMRLTNLALVAGIVTNLIEGRPKVKLHPTRQLRSKTRKRRFCTLAPHQKEKLGYRDALRGLPPQCKESSAYMQGWEAGTVEYLSREPKTESLNRLGYEHGIAGAACEEKYRWSTSYQLGYHLGRMDYETTQSMESNANTKTTQTLKKGAYEDGYRDALNGRVPTEYAGLVAFLKPSYTTGYNDGLIEFELRRNVCRPSTTGGNNA